eukprot:scaffold1896_cov262-Pinguiococcus_pyrenoidosus.AAC.2
MQCLLVRGAESIDTVPHRGVGLQHRGMRRNASKEETALMVRRDSQRLAEVRPQHIAHHS